MSRIIIKGLPKRYDDAQLRALFAGSGEVTDARVMRTAEGRSRQFGFVGFRSAGEARGARAALDGTFVETARVCVQVAVRVGSGEGERPWSRYAPGSSAFEKREGKEGKDGKNRKNGTDGRREDGGVNARKGKEKERESVLGTAAFQEFQGVAARRSQNPIWADGAVEAGKADKKKTSMVASRKTGAEGKMLERSHVVFGDDDDDDADEDDMYEELPVPKSLAIVSPDAEGDVVARDDGVSDADYFKSKVRETVKDDEDSDSDDSDSESSTESDAGSEIDSDEQEADAEEKSGSPVEAEMGKPASRFEKCAAALVGVDAAETGRLFIRNLAFSANEEDLESEFERFGVLADVHLVTDPETGRSRGVAFISYVVPENAARAMAALDGTFFCGRIMHVLPGKPRPQGGPGGRSFAQDGNSTAMGSNAFKQERENARKDDARTGADGIAQNAMHMSADAVAQVIADRHGVSKSELYGADRGESGVAAVRLAMGEATLQGETREFLLSHGIDMGKALAVAAHANAKTQAAKRKRMSRTAFLVKNLPARTTESELETIFAKFGTLGRLLLVPSGLLAVIEFMTSGEAKRAYSGLAYTRFKDAPLYLEWLPSEAIVDKPSAPLSGKDTPQQAGGDKLSPGGGKAPSAGTNDIVPAENRGEDAEGAALPSLVVYVKNLNFDTRDEALKEHFKSVLRKRPKTAAAIRSATVATKSNPKNPGTRLSMGFGFVEFASQQHAGEAVKIAQNSVLNGHTLQLRLSTRSGDGGDLSSKKRGRKSKPDSKRKPSAKLVVRNIAFEATQRDVRQLFSAFGQIKTVRLPRKIDGSHRGFGFIEFVSKNEATSALNALTSAHLYGRHLVIDYADETDESGFASLAELQERAARQMPASKRRRVDGGTATADDEDEENLDAEAQMRDELYA